RHSADLGLDRVLAVSPVFDIKNEWETRWRDDLKAMSPQKTMIAASDDLSASCDYMMVFDPAADIEHIRRFEQIIRPDRLKLLPLPQTGSDLAEPGVRDDFAVEALKTGEFPPAANVQRKRQA
ncbi:MAG: hypothetical protein JWR77_2495, partial [Rhizorhabdus sp.]|nr:hypothetical protein [Rhizorhabdus sp.]